MIEVNELTKIYGSTVAVNKLSFSVTPGIVTGFLGPNGAGKSTTMRMILGLDNPTSGSSTINGTPYGSLQAPLTQVGSLLDANWVHPNRSARAHLGWMAKSNNIPSSRVAEVLDLVGLTEVAKKRAGEFSLGMKQRLGLAGALLGDPQVLLFDEPVNGLDPEGILWIRTLMRRLASQGRTVLVSSHMLSEMALTADHLVVIGRGQLIADAPTKEFIAAATQSTVVVRSPQAADLAAAVGREPGAVVAPGEDGALVVTGIPIARIGDIAAAGGFVLHELSPQNGSLEQAFMQLTGQSAQFASHWDGGASGQPAPVAEQPAPGQPAPGQPAPGQPAPAPEGK